MKGATVAPGTVIGTGSDILVVGTATGQQRQLLDEPGRWTAAAPSATPVDA